MDKAALLAELRALAAAPPDFATYAPSSRAHLEWLGKCHALVARCDKFEAMSLASASNLLPLQTMRDSQVAAILNVVHRTVADHELQVGTLPPQAFGPGAVYDFMKSLRDLLASTVESLFIVDPYLDDQIFDSYLAPVSSAVGARLLTRDSTKSLRASLNASAHMKLVYYSSLQRCVVTRDVMRHCVAGAV